MVSVMENDFTTTVDAVLLGDSLYPIDGYNQSGIFLAPRRDPLYIVIPMTIIYALIFITGVVGNVITFVVIVRNKYMHTATNYYLFSLAISDLLLLVSGLPQEMVSIWCRYPYMFGEVFCVLRGLSAETSTNASVLTITAFTVERYVAICHPFLAQTMSKLSRAVKLIVMIWLVALSFAIPQAIQFGVVAIDNDPNQAMCTLKRIIIDHSFVLSSFLFFVAPMVLITVLYALIGIKLRKSNMMKRNGGSFYSNCENRNSLSKRNYPPHHQSSRRVLKMLVAVVVAFFVCWAPFHAQRLVYMYGSNKENKPKGAIMKHIYEIITYVSGILYYVSTTINPILYHIMSLKFRQAFKDTLARCTGLPAFKSSRRRRSYSILNRYYQRGTQSGGGTHSDDADNSNNYLREDSIPSNGLNSNYDTESLYLSRYKCRRKTISVSAATEDSFRTEITQASQRMDSLSRGSSQSQFVVMHISQSQVQTIISHDDCWRDQNSLNGANKLWKVFECIKPNGRKKSIISKYSFQSISLTSEDKSNLNSGQAKTINGNLKLTEDFATSSPKKDLKDYKGKEELNNISNSSLKEFDKCDLREELASNGVEDAESDDLEERKEETLDVLEKEKARTSEDDKAT